MAGYTDILTRLVQDGVRFVVIGVGAVNYYAGAGRGLFSTQDRDLFLPLDTRNLLSCWRSLLSAGWNLYCNNEPLGEPVDLWLAERVITNRATVKALSGTGLEIDLTLTMSGFHFDQAWAERRAFAVAGDKIPVARLKHVIESKRAAGRPKDLLFLSTHEALVLELLHDEQDQTEQ